MPVKKMDATQPDSPCARCKAKDTCNHWCDDGRRWAIRAWYAAVDQLIRGKGK